MAFRSDAHRRWWFANRAMGGGGSGVPSSGSGGGSAAAPSAESTQSRRDARIAYASAMYPELSEPDALRKLNDREGFEGLPKV